MLTELVHRFAAHDIVLFLAVIASFFIYNSVVGKKNEVENALGGLDAQLKQRYDLIPNLVESVKVYMKHEEKMLTSIVELRSRALSGPASLDQKAQLNSEISRGLSSIIVQAEQYPDLKSNTNFIQLQGTLYEVEQNIAASRRFYNSAVTDYNNALEMIPTNFFARMLGYKRKDIFTIPDVERAPVKVAKLFEDKAS